MPIDRVIIDSSDAITDLCKIGLEVKTDKSPYNTLGHRHPYTGVYTMLFSTLRTKPIRFAEIGVARGSSAHMWSLYFTNPVAQIHMFDRDQDILHHVIMRVDDSRMTATLMDVGVDGDVTRALKGVSPEGDFDVILDDSSHEMGHQIRIIHEGFPLLKSGGMLIIEDVFKSINEAEYEEALKDVLPGCAAAYFVVCEHRLRWSPGWDNDKLLVLVKG